jgi:hypothetical protein
VLLNNAERMKLASDPSMKDLLLSSMPSAFAKRRRSEAFGQVEDEYRAIVFNGVCVNTTSEFLSALSVTGFSTVTFELLRQRTRAGGVRTCRGCG